MNDIDFTACEFIDKVMCFLDYDDFCKNCRVIKCLYSALEKNAKRFYKWYVYANIHIEEEIRKNAIWNYLNSDDPDVYAQLIYRKTHKN